MLEGDARRALEEEAIALVNLSNSLPAKHISMAPEAMTGMQRHQQAENATLPDIHPLLQQKKAALMARRDDCSAPHPHRVNKQALREKDRDSSRCLSMSVFVNADGKMSVVPRGKDSPDHHAAFELGMSKQVGSNVELLGVASHEGPISSGYTAHANDASSPTRSPDADSHNSLQSLLVTLKKRKAEDVPVTKQVSPTKLPRFRDVFVPPRAQTENPPQAASPMPNTQSPLAPAPVSSTDSMEATSCPPPPELKCKYRTGKCTNARALKSCGDYHNLCNYHRLRANANQRKLDRKKKVQRQQPGDADADAASAEAAPAVVDPTAAVAAAAAASLACIPTPFMASQLRPRPSSNGSHMVFLPYLLPPSVVSSAPATTPPQAKSS